MGLIGMAAIVVFAWPGVAANKGPADAGTIFGLSVAILVLLCGSGVAVAGGIGLLLAKGWGRILSIINAVLNLLAVPIGTVIGILVLIYLMRPEIREYFEGGSQ